MVRERIVAGQKPNYRFFTTDTGQCTHPHIEITMQAFVAGIFFANASVLRTATIGDIHIGHHFQGDNDFAADFEGQGFDIAQNAIDTKADS